MEGENCRKGGGPIGGVRERENLKLRIYGKSRKGKNIQKRTSGVGCVTKVSDRGTRGKCGTRDLRDLQGKMEKGSRLWGRSRYLLPNSEKKVMYKKPNRNKGTQDRLGVHTGGKKAEKKCFLDKKGRVKR